MNEISDQAIFESVIWPKYKEPVSQLCSACWRIAQASNEKIAKIKDVPVWFTEIVQVHVKTALGVCFGSPNRWLIFPDFLEGYSLIIYKFEKKTQSIISPNVVSNTKRLQEISDIGKMVEKTIVQIIKGYTLANGNVIEMENEDAIFYIVPKVKLGYYLEQLGFTVQQLNALSIAVQVA